MRHRAATHADLSMLYLVDRGQVGRQVARPAIEARGLAIAETRGGVVQGRGRVVPALDSWAERIGEHHVICA